MGASSRRGDGVPVHAAYATRGRGDGVLVASTHAIAATRLEHSMSVDKNLYTELQKG